MADSKLSMTMGIFLALACFSLLVCVVAGAAPAPADDDSSISNTNTTTTVAINTSSALPLRSAGAAAPSISTRRNLDTDGGRSPSSTLCLHRASTQAYDGVVPLKDGSGRLVCWNRDGQVWLAAVDVGTTTTGSVLLRVGGKPLIDLRTLVSQDSAAARGRGLAGVAVDSSSRLFVSYYTSTVGPDGDGGGAGFLVVDQLSVSWSEHEQQPTTSRRRRVFSMALADDESESPSSSASLLDYYGGQVLFRPTTSDPFLYLVTGPAQSDGQLQAKILRIRVGQDMSSGGNGTVTPMEAQLYASGLGIPRRCAFDADRPQDLYCAILRDVQDQVYLISDPDAPSYSTTPPSPSLLVANQRPTPGTPPSLVGGLLYRGDADTTLTGSYIYMDGSEIWVTEASPARNHTTTRNLRVTCSASAMPTCRGGDFAGGGVTSFGEDEGNNALMLATDGVYQVVGPSLCHAATHASMSTKKLLEWVFGVIGTLLTTLGGGYAVYKKRKCFYRNNDININAPNGTVTVLNGNNGVQLAVNN